MIKKILFTIVLGAFICPLSVLAENIVVEDVNIPQIGGNHLNEIVNLDHIRVDSGPSIEPIRVPIDGALPKIDRHPVPDSNIIDNAITSISKNVDVKAGIGPRVVATSVSAVAGSYASPPPKPTPMNPVEKTARRIEAQPVRPGV